MAPKNGKKKKAKASKGKRATGKEAAAKKNGGKAKELKAGSHAEKWERDWRDAQEMLRLFTWEMSANM